MMASLRGTLLRLRPADFEKFGLAESLRQLVDVWSASRRRQTRFELDIPPEITLPDNAAIHIFRIAQEGLTNAAKHAGASHVRLCVEPIAMPAPRRPDAVGIRLTIEDDGSGWHHEVSQTNGRGLINMQERVAALGGTIAFDDRPGAGLKVRVIVPVIPEEAAGDGHPRH
ncbi:MAG: ATP-binding protein [Hyphomicrobium sp.]